MRTGTLVMIAVLSGTVGAWCGEPETSVRIAVNLADGSRISGVPEKAKIVLRTEFAQLDVPLAEITSAVMQTDKEHLTVTFKNGDRLTGVPEAKEIRLTGELGSLALPVGLITSIEVLAGTVVNPSGAPKGTHELPKITPAPPKVRIKPRPEPSVKPRPEPKPESELAKAESENEDRPRQTIPAAVPLVQPAPKQEPQEQAQAKEKEEDAWKASLSGVGPIKIGYTTGRISAYLKPGFAEQRGDKRNGRYVLTTITPDVRLMINDGVVVGALVCGPSVRTDDGVGVGDSEQRLKEIYGERLHDEDGIDRKGGRRFILRASGQTRSIVFKTDGTNVTWYCVGKVPDVETARIY